MKDVGLTARWAGLPGGTVVDERTVDGLGRLTTTVLDLDADVPTLHAWCTARGTAFWGLADLGVDELRATYAGVATVDHHHALLVRADGTPVALVQAYEPAHDPVGDVYDVRAGDLGMHVLVGARPPQVRPGTAYAHRLVPAVAQVLADATGATRVVGEPDARNAAMLRVAERSGAVLGPEVDLPTKRARLTFWHPDPCPPPTAERGTRPPSAGETSTALDG
ncbi:GNAT family N-acetyltransferase [Cellulomonas wangsupingiae]|uniref:Acetyltransferase n=2 Tax=Cellulomonas wangsupingiae TaxID=2968085 RepID=A0ABY5K4H4_9CELL|nr:GNAT family N-acetyltransferase [Cellulomonas wangsupingiae]UUI65357.1 acetyltransferase [Cellulomonas wangsupingiae]